MNAEEMLCEAEDLVREGRERLPAVPPNRNPSTGIGATAREMRINDPALIGALSRSTNAALIKPTVYHLH